MSHDHLPPSPFGAGTVYTGHEKHIKNPFAEHDRLPRPRIARAAGVAAMHEITEPIPRIAVPEAVRAGQERHKYLKDIFRFPDPKAKDRYGRPLSQRTEVTPESEADAAYAYRFADQDIKDIIAPYKNEQYFREEDMPELLRTNDELRIALGMHLLNKFSTIVTMLPDRVATNSEHNLKSPNHAGYPDKMRSRDYADMLALSMLDGTFRKRRDAGETSQHRDAAQMVLGIYGQLKSDEAWNKAFGN